MLVLLIHVDNEYPHVCDGTLLQFCDTATALVLIVCRYMYELCVVTLE